MANFEELSVNVCMSFCIKKWLVEIKALLIHLKFIICQSSSTWINDMMIVGNTARATMRGKVVPGYVQKNEVSLFI